MTHIAKSKRHYLLQKRRVEFRGRIIYSTLSRRGQLQSKLILQFETAALKMKILSFKKKHYFTYEIKDLIIKLLVIPNGV